MCILAPIQLKTKKKKFLKGNEMKKLLLLCLIGCTAHSMHNPNCLTNRTIRILAIEKAEKRKKLFYETAEQRLITKQYLDAPAVEGETTTLLSYFAPSDISMTRRLLAAGAAPSGQVLCKVIMESKFEAAQELLKYNADPNTIDMRMASLHRLCHSFKDNEKLRVEFVKLLLFHKAGPNIYDDLTRTPLFQLFSTSLPDDQKLRISAITERKQIMHELIFHGAHLITSKYEDGDPQPPVELAKKIKIGDSDLLDLARYAEKKYVFRVLQLLWKSKESNLVKTLPKELLKLIADRI